MQRETLEQFRERIGGFEYHSLYPDQEGCFRTNPRLNDKVDPKGRLRAYVGNTVVFTLDGAGERGNAVRNGLRRLQDRLYACCPDMFAERLGEETFHMTLHDLMSGPPGQIDESVLRAAGERAEKFVEAERRALWTVRLSATCAFNMVNTSVVLGLEPCDEDSCRRLMELYGRLEEIVPLGYPLTPHITLAYYRPGVYREADMKRLETAFELPEGENFAIEFTPEDLACQDFCDMNHYITRKPRV